MKINAKKLIISLVIILSIILIFTLGDYFIHTLEEEYAVPPRYFINKIIYGTIIGFITFLFVKKKKLLTKSLIFSAVVSILLQVRYFLEGYPKDFVFLFLAIHFAVLFPLSLIIFRLFEKYIKEQ